MRAPVRLVSEDETSARGDVPKISCILKQIQLLSTSFILPHLATSLGSEPLDRSCDKISSQSQLSSL